MSSFHGVPLLTHALPSSGMIYVDLALSLSSLSIEDIRYLPLLSKLLVEAGTNEMPRNVLGPLLGRSTGGVSTSFSFEPVAEIPYTVPNETEARGFFLVSGKVTSF